MGSSADINLSVKKPLCFPYKTKGGKSMSATHVARLELVGIFVVDIWTRKRGTIK